MSLFVDLAVILSYGSVELAAGTKFPRNAMKGTNDNSQWQDIAENGQTHEVGLSHLISIFFVWPSLSTVTYVEIWPVIEEIHDHVLIRNDRIQTQTTILTGTRWNRAWEVLLGLWLYDDQQR